jgi:NAD(P)-dependent dehydrogenase (short-subunit alcohol dehydrogenase family)
LSARTLHGRRIVVTGGSMGIGYACAEAVVRAGARLLIAARGEASLEEAARRLGELGEVHAVVADVGDEAAVAALFTAVDERLGGVDGLVHAAAVLGPIGPAIETPPGAWWSAVRTNLFGSFLVARAAALRMRGRGGRIVLFSGGGATGPLPNFTAYGASKAAVVRLTETLARELEAEGIAVNCVAPGFVATRMQQQVRAAGDRAGATYQAQVRERLANGAVPPQLAAEAAVFLLGEASAGITGRLLAAPWDDWRSWPPRAAEIADSDLFTLRRIVPSDRGLEWS